MVHVITLRRELVLTSTAVHTGNANISFDTKNVIYVITCLGCKFYIGGTGNNLRARARVHKQNINKPVHKQINLSEHIDDGRHKHFHFFQCYKLTAGDNICRWNKEFKRFIRILKRGLKCIAIWFVIIILFRFSRTFYPIENVFTMTS